MYPSTSSYRSSSASSRKRILRRKEVKGTDNRKAVRETVVRSRLYSHGSSEKPSSVASACSTNNHHREEKSSQLEAPMAVFLRSLFLRCFTTRKKRRKRARAMRKTNNDKNKQHTRNDSFDHIPTNAHEMFFQLHSKSRRSFTGQSLASSSNEGSSTPNGSPSRQLRRNSRTRSTRSTDTKSPPRHITTPVVIVEDRSQTEPFLFS